MKKLLLSILLIQLLSANLLFCQVIKDKSHKFSGIVLDEDSLKPINKVQILINNEKLVISKENGQFYFSANPKDTVIIFREGLKDVGIIIPDTLLSEKNLIGIFMAKDSVKAENIIIYSKLEENDLRKMMLKNQPKDQQVIIAENNAKSISYQAKTKNNLEWDATTNQKNTMRLYESHIEYKYMISPDQMIMVSNIIPYIKKAVKEHQKEKTEIEISKKEVSLLKEIFLRNRKKR